jgi:peroxiredoxin
MALTESTMLGLGTPAPDFTLPDVVSGATISLESFAGRTALLVIFLSRHCPYVQHIKDGLARLSADYAAAPLGIVAICSNHVLDYPLDSPANLRDMALQTGLNFPICYDESQEIAKAYQAACTPDFFLFDAGCRLVYRGQFDSSRPGNGVPVTGQDLRAAIDAVLAGSPVPAVQKPSLGCNIKWRPGTEPPYAR